MTKSTKVRGLGIGLERVDEFIAVALVLVGRVDGFLVVELVVVTHPEKLPLPPKKVVDCVLG